MDAGCSAVNEVAGDIAPVKSPPSRPGLTFVGTLLSLLALELDLALELVPEEDEDSPWRCGCMFVVGMCSGGIGLCGVV